MSRVDTAPLYDAIIIGSGFGGAATASALVGAGEKVLMLERGDWVARGPENWHDSSALELSPYYSMQSPYRLRNNGSDAAFGAFHCVGGQSIFSGCVSLRFRAEDFEADPEITGDSGARWPYSYQDLEPYYARAEALLHVAGDPGGDPTEPPRSTSYPQPAPPLAQTSRRISTAAARLGLHPFRLPLAINYSDLPKRTRCITCLTCDAYPCAIGAKNDVASHVLPPLMSRGLELKPNVVVTRLVSSRGRVEHVECVDTRSGERLRLRARRFVVSAGVFGSPQLLLASGLDRQNPGGDTVGRFLMRHCNGMVFGFFPAPPNKEREFHKQVGINDFYFGHPSVRHPRGKLGCIQQVMSPPLGLVRARVPRPFHPLINAAADHVTGLLVVAEDQPRAENRLTLDPANLDRFGLPQGVVEHHYTPRDLAARTALLRKARQLLRTSGAYLMYVHRITTFSHAVGTVRTGVDPRTSALDEYCRFRGVDNLYVLDGSFMPTAAAVNPSLTIVANALRSADHMIGAGS
jgi:choline dehydrogenase-like flavoprotein